MEEGTQATLPPHELGVVVGEPVRFRFFGSSVRREDKAGAELESWKEGELEELAPIEVTLPAQGRSEGDVVPVRLGASVTEVGTLLLEAVPIKPLEAALVDRYGADGDKAWAKDLDALQRAHPGDVEVARFLVR